MKKLKKTANLVLALAVAVLTLPGTSSIYAAEANPKNAAIEYDISKATANLDTSTAVNVTDMSFSDNGNQNLRMAIFDRNNPSPALIASTSSDFEAQGRDKVINITKDAEGSPSANWIGPQNRYTGRYSDHRVQVFSMDCFVPYATWKEGDSVSFQVFSRVSETGATDAANEKSYHNTTLFKYGNADMPKNEWFTLKFVLDTRGSDGKNVYYSVFVEKADGTQKLIHSAIDASYAGFINYFRIYSNLQTTGASFYFDNIRVYDDTMVYSGAETGTWFCEDFESNQYDATTNGIYNNLHIGIARGSSAVTSTDYFDGEEYVSLKLTATADGTVWAKNSFAIPAHIENRQRYSYRLYIPSDYYKDNNNEIQFLISSNGANYTKRINATGTNANGIIPVFDEWFDFNIDIDYTLGNLIISTVTGNGETKVISSEEIHNNYKLYGLEFVRIAPAAGTSIYIGRISHSAVDSMPSVIDFKNLPNKTARSNSKVYINNNSGVAPTFVDDAPGNVSALKLTSTTTAVSGRALNFTHTAVTNANKDTTVLSAKLYIPDTFREKDTIHIHTHFNQDAETQAALQQPYSFVIYGDYIAGSRNIANPSSPPNSASVLYPKNEWFTVSVIVNHDTNLETLVLTTENRTTYVLAKDVKVPANATSVRCFRMDYLPEAANNTERSVYIKEIAASSYNIGDIEISGATVSLPYTAIGDSISDEMTLIAASYSNDGKLVDVKTQRITEISNGKDSFSLTLDDVGDSVLGMLWKSLDSMIPIK